MLLHYDTTELIDRYIDAYRLTANQKCAHLLSCFVFAMYFQNIFTSAFEEVIVFDLLKQQIVDLLIVTRKF